MTGFKAGSTVQITCDGFLVASVRFKENTPIKEAMDAIRIHIELKESVTVLL